MILRGKNNVKTIIVTAYFPKISTIAGVPYSQKLEALAIMKVRIDPRTKFWIELNTEIVKWVD